MHSYIPYPPSTPVFSRYFFPSIFLYTANTHWHGIAKEKYLAIRMTTPTRNENKIKFQIICSRRSMLYKAIVHSIPLCWSQWRYNHLNDINKPTKFIHFKWNEWRVLTNDEYNQRNDIKINEVAHQFISTSYRNFYILDNTKQYIDYVFHRCSWVLLFFFSLCLHVCKRFDCESSINFVEKKYKKKGTTEK